MNKKEKNRFKKNLKRILGFPPRNISLYEKAFIHKSATYINHKNETINNERLEFLGDAILDSAISEYLFKKYPTQNEGFLTKTRAKIVNTKKLAEISGIFKLNRFLEIKTENSLNKEHLYADTLEALIGAIYLDRGYQKVKKFVVQKILIQIIDLEKLIITETNHKSNLIEWCQKKGHAIVFDTLEHENDHKLFVAKVLINEKEIAEGYGQNKKTAEQMAALKAIKQINPRYNDGKKAINNTKK